MEHAAKEGLLQFSQPLIHTLNTQKKVLTHLKALILVTLWVNVGVTIHLSPAILQWGSCAASMLPSFPSPSPLLRL